ncbi:ShlB/FhaC/HecB family hemolysin secretion/activation protein [Rhodospirillum sp. A1_3_36]|uniref:ShlB/FhaC/HecB family hemolysin secretion/activation protein n=1 Tax=Rhodospirillum sp. A1_3_36 TaxID=3391666 RepID=UPI0039A6CC59
MMGPGRTSSLWLFLLGLGLLPLSSAWAQTALERSPPPAAQDTGGGLHLGEMPDITGEDATPLGVTLSGVRFLIGLDVPIGDSPPMGVTLSGEPHVAVAELTEAVSPFLGGPLSRQVLSEIEAAVSKVYRRAGRPFLSVTTPPQDITSGVVRLRLVHFRTGEVRVEGNGKSPMSASDASLTGRVRVPAGAPIDANQIAEDLEWLNRFPFRRVDGVFEPGSQPGLSDLTLDVSREMPVSAFAGWSNTGTKTTDQNRYFLGALVGVEALNDLTLSYQMTASGDVFIDPASITLPDDDRPSYLSHAGRITLPTFDRQAIEISPSFVATSQDAFDGLFTFKNTAFELPVAYRSALSNIFPDRAGWGDVRIGVAPKWLQRETDYLGTTVAKGSAQVFDLSLGWSGRWTDGTGGSTEIDLRVVGNPGGLLKDNTDAAWSTYSNGRVTSAQYAYGFGAVKRSTPLDRFGGPSGFTLKTDGQAQIAGQALPDTEQMSLGGYYATRGFSLDDGSFDTGFVLRDELRAPTFSPLALAGVTDLPGVGAIRDVLSPYAFLDLSYGHKFNVDKATVDANATLLGVGGGLDYALSNRLQAGAFLGVALTDGPDTRRGNLSAQARLTLFF